MHTYYNVQHYLLIIKHLMHAPTGLLFLPFWVHSKDFKAKIMINIQSIPGTCHIHLIGSFGAIVGIDCRQILVGFCDMVCPLQWLQMNVMASRLTCNSTVCLTVCSWYQQKNPQIPHYWPFVKGIHQSPHKLQQCSMHFNVITSSYTMAMFLGWSQDSLLCYIACLLDPPVNCPANIRCWITNELR